MDQRKEIQWRHDIGLDTGSSPVWQGLASGLRRYDGDWIPASAGMAVGASASMTGSPRYTCSNVCLLC